MKTFRHESKISFRRRVALIVKLSIQNHFQNGNKVFGGIICFLFPDWNILWHWRHCLPKNFFCYILEIFEILRVWNIIESWKSPYWKLKFWNVIAVIESWFLLTLKILKSYYKFIWKLKVWIVIENWKFLNINSWDNCW